MGQPKDARLTPEIAQQLCERTGSAAILEGSIASVIASMAFGVAYLRYFIPGVSLIAAVALTTAANVAGQVGDLAESKMKRGANRKDSGGILPGLVL